MRKTMVKIFAVTLAALGGCGGATDPAHPDGGSADPDAGGFPPPPVLGAQVDRIGRPEISTLLIGTFAAEPTRTTVKDAYRQASDPTAWKTTMLRPNVSIELELETNLAAFDALDASCGNALRYNPPPGPMSYVVLADLFADDQLYVDTSKPTCPQFFALELEYGSFFELPAHTACGGRMPTHDAIDMMYSVLAAGTMGVALQSNGLLTPLLHDGAPVHGDVKDTFPFLGPPH